MNELLAMPREWLAATGEIGRFTGSIVGDVYGLRVFRFFGETPRRAKLVQAPRGGLTCAEATQNRCLRPRAIPLAEPITARA
jgi:hypothetical protein